MFQLLWNAIAISYITNFCNISSVKLGHSLPYKTAMNFCNCLLEKNKDLTIFEDLRKRMLILFTSINTENQ